MLAVALERLARGYFSRKGNVCFYLYRETQIATTPLVMTQTLNKISTRSHKDVYLLGRTRIVLIRDEVERLRSAYMKKIRPQEKTLGKKFLLVSSGLDFDISPHEFMARLMERQTQGGFIDRHFVPQKALYERECLEWGKSICLGSPEFYKVFGADAKVRKKSSLAVSGVEHSDPLFDPIFVKKAKKYIALW